MRRTVPLWLFLCFGHPDRLYSQDSSKHGVHILSLSDVIRIAKVQNKLVKASKEDEKASAFDLQDARDEALPTIGVNGAYQRYSKVTVFQNGLADAQSIRRPPDPNSASLETDAGFLVYGGGKVKATIEEKELRSALAHVNTNDQAGQTATQAALLYLQIVGLYRQDSLIAEQIRRAVVRVKNIRSLYENERVTRSDLLRAEVDLSTQQLNREQTENDIFRCGQGGELYGFVSIMTGKGMMALDNPIYIIRYLGKECCAITLLEVFKQRTDLVK